MQDLSSDSRISDSALITAQNVAELLNVHVRTVHRLKSTGKLPHPVKFAGNVRWRYQDIQKWIDMGCPVGND
ncbi:helix-turn-helix transcriptional regulator [Gimesia maris]|uniref:helix-turn-helix transcriptional regulator n=1 Tax=Gimesia maris TaxID=122 RepID=UPI003A8D379C